MTITVTSALESLNRIVRYIDPDDMDFAADRVKDLETDITALAAERDALLAYTATLEAEVARKFAATGASAEAIAFMLKGWRTDHIVAHLLDPALMAREDET